MQLDTMQSACCASDNTSHSCSVAMHGQQGCDCASQAQSAVLLERPFSIEETRQALQGSLASSDVAHKRIAGSHRQNIRGAIMLGIACITSPCCTPLIIPAILGLLAGTPIALWLTQNVEWLYGGLTLVSVISLVMGLRWVWQKLSTPVPSQEQRPEITAEARVDPTSTPNHAMTGQGVQASAEESR